MSLGKCVYLCNKCHIQDVDILITNPQWFTWASWWFPPPDYSLLPMLFFVIIYLLAFFFPRISYKWTHTFVLFYSA
jgi:hypothetical protein